MNANAPSFVPTVLATIRSSSNPSKFYQIRMGRDGNVWCTCPAWKFQHAAAKGRTCKHLRSFAASATMPKAAPVTATVRETVQTAPATVWVRLSVG